MTDQAREIVSGPGAGRKVHVFGVVLTIRVASADAGGDFAVWEEAAPAGVGPPRHIHHRMDEAFQILEGHYQVWCDGRIHELEPGALAMIPKGMPHTFRCVGPTRGRMLTTVVPGGLDDFLIEIEARNFKLPDDLEQLMALGARYGHEFVGPPLGGR
jgi:mannose-6-phosphate isomerase-like protein (cupin superfamily)